MLLWECSEREEVYISEVTYDVNKLKPEREVFIWRWSPKALQLTRTWIKTFTIVSPFAMDNCVPDTKMTTRKRDRYVIFSMCSFTLSVISIVLGFALFTRIESVARDLRTMDTKFSQQIQQIRDILKDSSASSRGSENFDTSNGRVTENLLWIITPKFCPCVYALFYIVYGICISCLDIGWKNDKTAGTRILSRSD